MPPVFPVLRPLSRVLAACLLAAFLPTVRAQTPTTSITLKTLHTFQGSGDGSSPFGGLIAPGDGYFYGTTSAGGALGSNGGSVFRLAADGTVLILGSFPVGAPYSTLAVGLDGFFYGTGSTGGQGDHGFVFRTSPGGTTQTVGNFNGTTTGLTPYAGLVLGSDGSFYGTTTDGGANDSHDGVVFRLAPQGALTILHTFNADHSEGATPYGVLVQGLDGDYYGTTFTDGPKGNGTVFRVAGLGVFSTVYAFTGGADGGNPHAGLLLGSDGNFYGTTISGGSALSGTVFRLTPQGVLTTLHTFDPAQGDGIRPAAPLIDGGDGFLYGSTQAGGTGKSGTIFAVSTAGDFQTVYNFTGGADGAEPSGPLAPGGSGIFYGTTSTGGGMNNQGNGTVFRLNLRTPPDVPGSLAFSTPGAAVSEGAGSVQLTVSRTNGATGAVRVGYTTVDGSAKAGVDFSALSGTLAWADGDAAPKTLTVPISDAGNLGRFDARLHRPTPRAGGRRDAGHAGGGNRHDPGGRRAAPHDGDADGAR